MKPISKRTRERAALMCAVVASTPGFVVVYGWEHIEGVTQRDADLAFDVHAASRGESWSSADRWADAEALLRTGWRP